MTGPFSTRGAFTYVGDIVDGFVAAIERREACLGEIINIGSDREMTTEEGIRTVERILGKPARLKRVGRRPGDQLRTHANIDKARRLLDYRPETALEEGLRAEVEWFSRHHELLTTS